MNPYKKQVGGNHYKKYKIQPVDFIIQNKLDFCQGSVIKYVVRFKEKGLIADLDKAIHYIELLKDQLKVENSI